MISQPLSKLPEMFGFKSETKGHFPHRWVTLKRLTANETVKLPSMHYFYPGQMRPDARKEFEAWWHANKENDFNIRQASQIYGRQDVRILALGCLKFRQEILNISGIDPWLSVFTLASLCSYIYRGNLMPSDSIGLVPANGYNQGSKMQSLLALKYLHWVKQERGIDIRTAATVGGEQRLPGIMGPVDGYCKETGIDFTPLSRYFNLYFDTSLQFMGIYNNVLGAN